MIIGLNAELKTMELNLEIKSKPGKNNWQRFVSQIVQQGSAALLCSE